VVIANTPIATPPTATPHIATPITGIPHIAIPITGIIPTVPHPTAILRTATPRTAPLILILVKPIALLLHHTVMDLVNHAKNSMTLTIPHLTKKEKPSISLPQTVELVLHLALLAEFHGHLDQVVNKLRITNIGTLKI
jgi:hypothetical protein